MDRGMDDEPGRIDIVFALAEDRSLLVDLDQGRGRDLGPVPAIGVNEKPVAARRAVVVRHGHGEMVVDAFVQVKACGPA